jgi:hypothetical protein
VNALSETYYSRYAQARAAEAQRTIDRHAVCAYTGVCLACGRPGPCPERNQAEQIFARYSRSLDAAPPDNRSRQWDRSPTPGTQLAGGGSLNSAIRTADGTVEGLRTACLAATEALERTIQQVDGVEHPFPGTALATFDSAVDAAWESLTMVYAGLAEARRLPGAHPPNIGDVLAGLREARLGAGRAAREIDRVRRQLATAADRLDHARPDPRARAAARRWSIAGSRLDLVAARLAIGTRALDRYAARLAGTPEPAALDLPTRLHRILSGPRPSVPHTRAGAQSAAKLILRFHPWGGWRGFMARWRHEAWKEFRRPWTA